MVLNAAGVAFHIVVVGQLGLVDGKAVGGDLGRGLIAGAAHGAIPQPQGAVGQNQPAPQGGVPAGVAVVGDALF